MVDIRPMTYADWPGVEAIYAEGIATGDATFETEPPSWEEFDRSRLRQGLAGRFRHIRVFDAERSRPTALSQRLYFVCEA